MKKKKNIKQWIGKIHLWLGLLSGLIVLILSITGCIYVFSQEITGMIRKEAMYVPAVAEKTIPISQLWQSTQAKVGTKIELSNVSVYNNPKKSWVFHCYKGNENAYTYFGSIEYYQSIYVDPYTGKVLGMYDEEMDFFNIVKFIHWSLLMETSIGQPIIGWSTFIFVIMLITGIVLWWPKNKSARKQRFAFQWKKTTQWKRKNYDLHNIFGFYISVIALIIAFTGMVWAFTWFQAIVYVAGSGTVTPPDIKKVTSIITPTTTTIAIDTAFIQIKEKHKDADAFQLSPAAANDKTGTISAYIQQKEGVYYIAHMLQFDQYTGKLLLERKHDEKNFGEKLITANYDIHVGAILGIPGKIMAFIASFICGMLPVTGFLIWYGRKFKKKPQKTT
ncbi:PepSY-associated TM helix domain-containing protein [Flavobacterium sp. '19STA2R22 D10 B1']|uniref:PepSY-associated TM helix domain-containing protein n=1 Tax=Flavobacterium aerium TaxID=3037261 RepID=UPI00278BC8B4|nr:PepSY-associated TM helix domain-containing protein [Flavobacterium sp. '19STA2R22 D10 B1']